MGSTQIPDAHHNLKHPCIKRARVAPLHQAELGLQYRTTCGPLQSVGALSSEVNISSDQVEHAHWQDSAAPDFVCELRQAKICAVHVSSQDQLSKHSRVKIDRQSTWT